MGYFLSAVIGRTDTLRGESLGGGVPVSLGQGLSLIPLVGGLGESREWGAPPASIVPRLTELSRRGPVAFVEAEFWGGLGDQACAVWREGRIVLGPLRAGDAINQALRLLGVVAESGDDEFDTVRLGRHRRTEGWLSEVGRA